MTLPCSPSFSLAGKPALVIGATSGIGEGCVLALSEAGAHVTEACNAQAAAFQAQGWDATVLASNAAALITGTHLINEGGWTAD